MRPLSEIDALAENDWWASSVKEAPPTPEEWLAVSAALRLAKEAAAWYQRFARRPTPDQSDEWGGQEGWLREHERHARALAAIERLEAPQ